MKVIKLVSLVFVFLIVSSCSSVKVVADYDSATDFSNYKTFAFYKKGIDKAEISDLDKRRILKAVEAQLMAKGFTKSEDPDILVNIFTKARRKVDVYNNSYGYGGYGGYGYGGYMAGTLGIMVQIMECKFRNIQRELYLLTLLILRKKN